MCVSVMSELLFECYGVPALAYGTDCLFSLSRNHCEGDEDSCLIISVGYQSTHVLPIIHGLVDWARVRRLDAGGYHITTYLHRLLQLKYPAHFAAITLSRAEVNNEYIIVCKRLTYNIRHM